MKRGPQAATTALMVLGFAAIVAVVVWRSSRAEPELEDEEATQEDGPTASSAPSSTSAVEGSQPRAEDEERGAAVASPTSAAQGRSPLEPENAPGVEPFPPEVREHAKQMIVPNTEMAMEKGDVKQLYTVLELVHQHRGEKLLPESDIGAIEAAIACLEQEPDARQEAADLLRFGPPTTFAAGLNKACSKR